MQLIYLWVKKYRHMEYDSGFNFSPEYKIKFESQMNTMTIEKNEKYIHRFYGNKVKEVTAIVGENGSGKSTTAEMITEYGAYLPAIIENSDKNKENFIQVYKFGSKLKIYYYLSGDELKFKKDRQIEAYDVSKLNDGVYGDKNYETESRKHKITAIYLSNVFDPKHLGTKNNLSNLSEGKKSKKLSYSPGFCLKLSQSLNKDQYGQNIGLLVHNKINLYAEKMVKVYGIKSYMDYQAELFIRCYKTVPESIKETLSIFKKFTLGVQRFAYYVDIRDENEPKDEDDKKIEYINKNIRVINDKNDGVLMQCFINILCEAYLFFTHKDNNVKMLIDEYIEREQYEIDVKLLNCIYDEVIILNDNKFVNLNWSKQLKDGINVFKKYKEWNFKLGEHTFEECDEFLNFYIDELNKNYSVFKKYLIFEPMPASTGEVALVNLFAYINDAFSKDKCPNILLVIDELDVNLHPRWQQLILNNLIDYLEKLESEKNIQLVITSHSPIMLSDMTRDRVIKLKVENKEKNSYSAREVTKLAHVESCKEDVLGANILKLFYDSFFMDKGSIGEFAKKKIKDVIEYNKSSRADKRDEIEYIIDNIGEPFVQEKLRQDFKQKCENNNSFEMKKVIQEIGYEEALRILKMSLEMEDIDDKN